MRTTIWLCALLGIVALLSFASPTSEAANGLAVQFTLYDLDADGAHPAAMGRAELAPTERRAKLYVLSADPAARVSYERDAFYVTRTGQDAQTGAVRFRVRHEQVVESRCTAMEIRDYMMRVGESRELYSERGQIHAVMKLVY
ncbi:MAG: hypothetical protein IJ812_06875 [Schwartzia sp.]|nr:hypothetical protein [Schwartzia sp. (in: firmicutes)]